jgi:ABC-type antimicrobial peptide transport system permease subunit
MRSSLLSRINEIGIYRAIGVSKKNLVYRFAVESGVLTALTVLLGYITASLLLMFVITNAGSLASEFVYYPWPIAAGVLVILVGGSIFFGILPVLTLLGKTPAQIIAKYDI